MSTPAEVIEQGDYLNDSFDPNKLNVAIIRGIFFQHGITVSGPQSKKAFLQTWEEQFRPRLAEFRRAREGAKRQQPSNEGILDGVTGQRLPSNEVWTNGCCSGWLVV